MPRPQMGILAGKNEPRIKEIHCVHHWKLQLFESKCVPFGLCNTPERLMQNCFGKLNFNYCLISLDNIVMYSVNEDDNLE